MRTMSYRLEDLEKVVICIGYAGENKHTQVRIDCASAFEEYPGATPALAVKPPRGGIYPAVIEQDGNTVVWTVTNSDLLFRGSGEIQLSFVLGDVIKKTVIGNIEIQRSIITTANVPDPVAEWLIRATAAAAAAEAAAQHQPKIEDDYWYVWDADAEEYVSTGIKAKGDKGDPGTPGDPTMLIDDESTEANKVWSASKSGELMNALTAMNPAATASDIGKALLVKTVADGKPTSWEYGEAGGGSVDPSAIAQAVDDWCDENITSDPTVVIDTSLLVSGAAADSAAVGEFAETIGYHSQEVDLVQIATETSGYKLNSSGAMESSGNYKTYTVVYDGSYDSFNASLYTNTTSSIKAIAFWDENDAVLSTVAFTTTSGASTYSGQTIPTGTKKILFCNRAIGSGSGTPSASCTIKVCGRIDDIEKDIESIDASVTALTNRVTYDEGILSEWVKEEYISNGDNCYISGTAGSAKTVTESASWRYTKYDVTGIKNIKVTTVLSGTSIFGVVFVDSSDNVIAKHIQASNNSDETFDDVLIAVPLNAYKVYINKRSSVKGDLPSIKIQCVKETDSTLFVNIGSIAYSKGKLVYGAVGSEIVESGKSNWIFAKFDLGNAKEIIVNTSIYDEYYSVLFTTSGNVVISSWLSKGTQTQETISNYKIEVPTNAKYVYVNGYNMSVIPSVLVPVTTERIYENASITLLSVNCGAFSYSDSQTTDEEYKAHWRAMFNKEKPDLIALSDFDSTFGELQETADVVLFGNTLRNLIGNGLNDENGLRIGTKVCNVSYAGMVDVGGGTGIWRKIILRFCVYAYGKNILVYVGHYQPGVGYETARETQYNNIIADAAASGYEYVIFCGDFNAQTISEYKPFTDAGYVLCNGGYTGDHITLRDIYADNIIYSSNFIEKSFDVVTDASLNTDHYPIVATLMFKS